MTCAKREAKGEANRESLPLQRCQDKALAGPMQSPEAKDYLLEALPIKQEQFSSSTPTVFGHWLEQPGHISEGATGADSLSTALPTGGSPEGESK